jgi:threonine dehydratase
MRRHNVRYLLFRMKTMVEAHGAMGVAAPWRDAVTPKRRVGVIRNGGNISERPSSSFVRNDTHLRGRK